MPRSPVILATGCSSGIGLELLRLFNCEKYTFVGTALPRSFDLLLQDPVSQRTNAYLYPLDVCDFAAASHLIHEIKTRFGPIDILINNAGISYRSVIEDMNPEDEARQIAVNYLGPMHLIRECLPEMRQRRRGRIVNVSSVGGMMAMPTMASYSASKFALEGASESLWYEMRPWDIKVTLVRPGFINSLAFKKVCYSQRKKDGLSAAAYAEHYSRMTQFVEKIMKKAPSDSADVAAKILKVIEMKKPPLRLAATPDARLFFFLRRLLPRALYHKLLYASLPGVKNWGQETSHE